MRAQHRQIGGSILGDDLGVDAVAIDQRDLDACGALHHVLVGQQVAIGRDDNARAAARIDDAAMPGAPDVHADHRRPHALDHRHHGA